ncbi:MAG: 30S ribosomal protein S8e [Aigarchaeota archaeon]|nr:30S ribosomal protein S8e [Aigarchaeota archaeon]MDW8092370.1 30S ribosomal protein S8e [Nitrososphaerota archaeon]
MTVWHTSIYKRKKSGGKKGTQRKRKRFERGDDPLLPVVGDRDVVVKRVRGGGTKVAIKSDNKANVVDPQTNTVTRTDVLSVRDNPANRDFARRGVITRGAIIETPLGLARVVSKPSSAGTINAVLIKQS